MKPRKTPPTRGLAAVVHARLVRLSSFMVKVAVVVLLLGWDQCPVDKHVDGGPGMILQSGSQSTQQTMEAVANPPDLLPEEKRVEVVSLIDALPTDANCLARTIRVNALLEELIRRKIVVVGRIYASDPPQLIEKLPSLLVANISQLEINRSHEN